MSLPSSRLQSRLFTLAVVFLFLSALVLTLAPAARERSWLVTYRFDHWIGFAIWAGLVWVTQREIRRRLPKSDQYLFPIIALLSGWGLLSIWRLDSYFGLRQTLWLIASMGGFALALRYTALLETLKRYKYLLLILGLGLTALTFLLGNNPAGGGPRLWLGCCGFYLQPSEPLKLLLVMFLSAFFDRRSANSKSLFTSLAPAAILAGLALLILIMQRDLGTASIFIFLFAILLFLASGKRRVLLLSFLGIVLAAGFGYFFIDIIHGRLTSWLNPWLDPSNQSYQIVQSLLAIANGGLLGRGIGLGNPGLVPVAHSDFIFSSIAEESGLLGTTALILLIALLVFRGLRIALQASDNFQRLLAGGLTAYLGAQSLLIIAGNLRLLPLTGVTLPFISYGGSSLMTSFAAALILFVISQSETRQPIPAAQSRPYAWLGGLLAAGFALAILLNTWWAVWRGPDLLTRYDNPRRAIADRHVLRGSLLDRNNNPITTSGGQAGSFTRSYHYPPLSPVIGYTHPVFGLSGAEAGLDDYLRGLRGNPASLIWQEHLLYGQPPPGLNARLSLDLTLQQTTDSALEPYTGAIVLLNAQNGEILAISSAPTFDANLLDEIGDSLNQDPASPLLNRATQGSYLPGDILKPLLRAALGDDYKIETSVYQKTLENFGFLSAPGVPLPTAPLPLYSALRVSPLQIAQAAALLSNNGLRPQAQLLLAVQPPSQSWILVSHPNDSALQVAPALQTRQTAEQYQRAGTPFWEYSASAVSEQSSVSWYISGTLPDWSGSPLVLVVLLEDSSLPVARALGQSIFNQSLNSK